MRSAVFLFVVVALISGCSTTNQQTITKVEESQHITRDQFIGKWDCMLLLAGHSIGYGDELDYKSDGSFSGISTTVYPFSVIPEHSLFFYSRPVTGSWELEGNKLTFYYLTQGDLIRRENKSSPVWDKIKEEKLEKEIRLADNKIYERLSSENFTGVPFIVSTTKFFSISGIDILAIEQSVDDEKFEGACSRKHEQKVNLNRPYMDAPARSRPHSIESLFLG
ncbi:hypothetical protein [Marinomonas transparens]|uniref:Lipocalin-like domain-containing protein n=1 Tax=Marinomonas transparens TaxID=2795388 RepID=A0A934JZQ3_9GAMM|nr:hypothetical protein [Marinomonas transparens]MBJ7540079.1 hypothetical protein [Marinomonas transparens]